MKLHNKKTKYWSEKQEDFMCALIDCPQIQEEFMSACEDAFNMGIEYGRKIERWKNERRRFKRFNIKPLR